MKKILLSVILCSSLSLCSRQDESMSPEENIEKLVTIGLKIAQDREVQEAVVQLYQAYLHLFEVTLQKIATEFGPEEKAHAQMILNYLAELVKDPMVRSIACEGGIPAGIDDEMQQQLESKIMPIIVVAQTYGPELQKMVLQKVMITKTTKTNGTPQPKPECIHFILDRIIEALELAQKSVQ